MTAPRQILTPGELPADVSTQTYSDGTTVTGSGTLPEHSPAQQDAIKPRGKPGPKPKVKTDPVSTGAAAAPSDDLAEFESEDLPAGAVAPEVTFSPEQMAVIQKMIGAAVLASKASQDPTTAARLAARKLETEKLPTQEEARLTCDDAVARGLRPRAILTDQGWYAHPEMARTKDVGVAKLGG